MYQGDLMHSEGKKSRWRPCHDLSQILDEARKEMKQEKQPAALLIVDIIDAEALAKNLD